jgi:WD40 repeat protein
MKIFIITVLASLVNGIIMGAELKKNEYDSTTITISPSETSLSTAFFSPDKKKIAALARVEMAYVTNTPATHAKTRTISCTSNNNEQFAWCGSFSCSGLLAIAKEHNIIELWNPEQQTYKTMHLDLCQEQEQIKAIAFNKESDKLIVAHTDLSFPATLIDIETEQVISGLAALQSAQALHVNSKNLVAVSFENANQPLCVWDYRMNDCAQKIAHRTGTITAITMNKHETLYGLGSKHTELTEKGHVAKRDLTVHVHNLLSNQTECAQTYSFDPFDVKDHEGFPCINSLCFSPDSCTIATAMGAAIIVQTLSNMKNNSHTLTRLMGHTNSITDLVMPENDCLYSASADNTMRVWDISNTACDDDKKTRSCVLM